MSTKQKRKAKPKPARKEKAKPPRRRKPAEERKKGEPVLPKKPEKRIAEPVPQKSFTLAVRLDGSFAVPSEAEKTLRSLRLKKRFSAVLLDSHASILGMLRRVKDYVTWGDVKGEHLASLLTERAEIIGGARLNDSFVKENFGIESVNELAVALARGQVGLKALWEKGVKPVFRLHAPSGGFDSSIKRPFGSRGELGYRGEAIATLVTRMM